MRLQALVAGCSKDERESVTALLRDVLKGRPADEAWTASVVKATNGWSVTLDGPDQRVRGVTFLAKYEELRDALQGVLERAGYEPAGAALTPPAPALPELVTPWPELVVPQAPSPVATPSPAPIVTPRPAPVVTPNPPAPVTPSPAPIVTPRPAAALPPPRPASPVPAAPQAPARPAAPRASAAPPAPATPVVKPRPAPPITSAPRPAPKPGARAVARPASAPLPWQTSAVPPRSKPPAPAHSVRTKPAPAPAAPPATPEVRERHTCSECGKPFVVIYAAYPDESLETAPVACPNCWQVLQVPVAAEAAASREYRVDKAPG